MVSVSVTAFYIVCTNSTDHDAVVTNRKHSYASEYPQDYHAQRKARSAATKENNK